MSTKFVQCDRATLYLLPPSVQDWLPGGHLARFVVEVVERLDLRSLKSSYTGCGSKPYNPEMLLALLFYGYATGVFSSRKLERGTYDSVAFRYIAANSHPDHDTIATFRRRFLPQLGNLFAQILLIAQQMEVLQLGSISLDGSKIKANASRHKALSYEHACKLEARIKAEVAELLAKAEAADRADIPDNMSIPEELERREKRLAAIAIVSTHLTRQPNDKQELKPTLENLAALPKKPGKVTELLADSGYFSEANVTACGGKEVTPTLPWAGSGTTSRCGIGSVSRRPCRRMRIP